MTRESLPVKFLTPTLVSILMLLLASGCGGVSKVVGTATVLGRESEELKKMPLADVEQLVSKDIDMNRIKTDPEGVVGQYVRIRGIVDLKGSKDFPLQVTGNEANKDAFSFILDESVFVIALNKYPEIKHGDYAEILGLVSKSRFLKATREIYPKEGIPDLVTIIAKDVKVIPAPVQVAPEPAQNPEPDTRNPANEPDKDGDGKPG